MAEFDVLIQGGTVVDGTGAPAFQADVAIAAGRIAAIGRLPESVSAARRIDARGRIVCPGFIDAHSHSDLSLLSDPHARSKVHQGVTTEVVGNCGLAAAPLASQQAAAGVREAIYIVDPDPSVAWTWRGVGEYLDELSAAKPSINVAFLAGHLAIKASVMGYDDRPGTADEIQRMRDLLSEALSEGAVGLSTGLMYAPLSFAPLSELVALGEVLAAADRVFAMHMRNYGDQLAEAVDEAVAVGETGGCRVQVSHLAVTGRRNWGKVRHVLDTLDGARGRGVRIKHDSYPYLAGSANLSQLLPSWVHDGGTTAMVARLRTPADRDRIRHEWYTQLAQHWDDILVCWVPADGDTTVVGKTMPAIAADRNGEPDAVALDLIAEHAGLITMIAFGRSEDDLRASLRHPDTMIGSDGLAVDPTGPSGSGHPHPRYYGCYPRLLGTYVRDEGVLSLEQAIHKCSGLVASTFSLTGRGTLAENHAADVVMFDLAGITDHATFLDPQHYPTGIDAVIVNGAITVDHGRHTGARTGEVLRA